MRITSIYMNTFLETIDMDHNVWTGVIIQYLYRMLCAWSQGVDVINFIANIISYCMGDNHRTWWVFDCVTMDYCLYYPIDIVLKLTLLFTL